MRDAIAHTPPRFEHCRGLIGSYRAVMSHNGADNARDNTPPASRDYPALLTRAPTHLSTVNFSPLLESAHPANLINIIADYAAPRSQWELRAKRYRRYEALALCAPFSLSLFRLPRTDYTSTDACHRGFTIDEKSLHDKKKRGKSLIFDR